MPYIGNQPAEQFTSFATQEFSTSATTSYTLDHAVTNENEIALFINNVRQQPGSGKAYTATGTALTLSAATASTDTMYCIFLGRALQTVVPATNSITAAMVGNDLISGKDALAATPADTDELLISDAGTIKRIDFSHLKTGITEADQWRVSANFTGDADPVTSNWERADTDGYGRIGTGMSESSGVFTFPSTGIWKIEFFISVSHNSAGASQFVNVVIQTATDGSSFDSASESYANIPNSNFYDGSGSISFIFDCTNTSTHKVRFNVTTQNSSTVTMGDSNNNRTSATFIRLGDT